MTETRSTPWLAIGTILVLVLLPVLYVLSVGPVAGLASRGYLGQDADEKLYVIYFPLTLALTYTGFVGDAMEWYASFFVGPPNKGVAAP